MSNLKHHIARKVHRCDECGRRIAPGSLYWRRFSDTEDHREHTNCLDFKDEPELPFGFNSDRSIK